MMIRQDLRHAREALAANNIEDSPLEAEILLRYTLKIDHVQLYLQLDRPLTQEQTNRFWSLIERRLNGEPSAYITNRREFYGLDFYVDSNVLIPRPETELLVEKALEFAQQHPVNTIADIGTGCGAIAVTLALNQPDAKVYATDISAAALKVAETNCRKHGVADRVCLLEGDLLEPLPELVNLIVANLPYVRQSDLPKVNTHSFEPELALNGGRDGLETIRRLCSQLTQKTQKTDKLSPCSASSGQAGRHLLLEIGQGQAEAVTAVLRSAFPASEIEVFKDLAGVGRVVEISR